MAYNNNKLIKKIRAVNCFESSLFNFKNLIPDNLFTIIKHKYAIKEIMTNAMEYFVILD